MFQELLNLEVLFGFTEATEVEQYFKRNSFSNVREFIQLMYDRFIITLKLDKKF